jgi:hypothetical protein
MMGVTLELVLMKLFPGARFAPVQIQWRSVDFLMIYFCFTNHFLEQCLICPCVCMWLQVHCDATIVFPLLVAQTFAPRVLELVGSHWIWVEKNLTRCILFFFDLFIKMSELGGLCFACLSSQCRMQNLQQSSSPAAHQFTWDTCNGSFVNQIIVTSVRLSVLLFYHPAQPSFDFHTSQLLLVSFSWECRITMVMKYKKLIIQNVIGVVQLQQLRDIWSLLQVHWNLE